MKYRNMRICAGEYAYRGFSIVDIRYYEEEYKSPRWTATSGIVDDWWYDGTFETLKDAKLWVDEMHENEYYLEEVAEAEKS